jgi:hypothetical protein
MREKIRQTREALLTERNRLSGLYRPLSNDDYADQMTKNYLVSAINHIDNALDVLDNLGAYLADEKNLPACASNY